MKQTKVLDLSALLEIPQFGWFLIVVDREHGVEILKNLDTDYMWPIFRDCARKDLIPRREW